MTPRTPTRWMSLAALTLALLGCADRAPVSSPDHSVTLRWNASTSQVTGYHIYRATNPAVEPQLLAVTPADTTQYVDTAVDPGQTYYYYVKSVDATGTESESANISATIPAK
jgi:fibronectin type 3 domain-containing protein